jgi:CubicO group peptidase (beta-lactamase class C family)
MPTFPKTRFTVSLLACAAFSGQLAGDELADRLDGYLQTLAGNGFAGVVLVAADDEIVFQKGYGMADREKEIPNTPETIFPIGSITKQFTAAAILKLEMAGKLRVTDPIERFFDGVPKDKRGITLHQLLTHTAGFRPALGFDFAPIGREEYVRLALGSELEHPPGETHLYSNVGYSLLAAIIEKVTGESCGAYMRRHLFSPAGMKDTGYLLPGVDGDRLAHGYRDGEDWGTLLDHPWAEDGPYWHLRGNGGILSTAGDMYRWHRALEGDGILSPEAKEKMYTRHVPEEGGGSYYGYGWSLVETRRGTRLITHNGGNPYFFADFLRFVDDDVVIFLAANSQGYLVEDAAWELARLIFDPDGSDQLTK